MEKMPVKCVGHLLSIVSAQFMLINIKIITITVTQQSFCF